VLINLQKAFGYMIAPFHSLIDAFSPQNVRYWISP